MLATGRYGGWMAAGKTIARTCARLELGGFRPSGNPVATNFFLAPVARSGEGWPLASSGRLMAYVCQFNLTDAPSAPAQLTDVALIVFFVDFDRFIETGRAPETWCLRTYDTLEKLAPLLAPEVSQTAKLKRDQIRRGFEGRWLRAVDYPLYDDPDCPGAASAEQEDAHVYATKLGGYPSNLQHTVAWPDDGFAFALQIASEAKVGLMWADRGIVYVGRHSAQLSRWAVSCQFY